MIGKIINYFRWDFKYLPYVIKDGVTNLFNWFKIIWFDRNYDYTYTLKILRHKIKLQSKYLARSNRHVNTQFEVNRMGLCCELLTLLIDESYMYAHLEYVHRKHEFEPVDESGEFFTVNSSIVKDDLDIYFNKYKRTYENILRDHPDSNRETIALLMSIDLHNKLKRIVFGMIEKEYEGWWI